jgi:uncharacterized protein YuzE
MKIDYDQAANAAYVRRFAGKIVDSEEVAPGIVYDYDEADRVVGIEILGVKQRTPEQFKDSVNAELLSQSVGLIIYWMDYQ